MRFPSKIVGKASVVFFSAGIGFLSLATGDAIGQISPPSRANTQETPKSMTSLANTSWQLIKLGQSQPLSEKPITLTFEKDRLAGSSGCNRYFGGFSVQGKQLKIKSPLGSTMMACPEPLMKQERNFLKALTAAKVYKINSKGQLEIQYSEGKQTQLLIFTPEKTTSVNQVASLKNTSWQLIRLGQSQPLAEKPITLLFSETNRLAGSSGCNRYMGTFGTQDQQFSIKSPLGSTRMACPDALMKQEQQFLKALAAAKSYAINAKGELEIQYSDGKQTQLLIFSTVKDSNIKGSEKTIYVGSIGVSGR